MVNDILQVEGFYDMYKDWQGDDKGYFLIKIYPEEKKLGIRYCDNESHEPKVDIFGKIPQDLYNEAIRRNLLSNMQHAAYLGKELYKAYVCLQLDIAYVQDEDLVFENFK
jgi:tetrahydromethanopterin S-methyltransferase subunit A